MWRNDPSDHPLKPPMGSHVAARVALFDEGFHEDEWDDRENNGNEEEYDDDDDDDDDDDESDNFEDYDDIVEKVSRKLVETESQLRRTRSRLKDSDDQIKALETLLESNTAELRQITDENRTLREEVDQLRIDMVDLVERDEGRARPELETRLRRAVDFLKKDLVASQEKYIASQAEVRSQNGRIEIIEESNQSLLATIRILEKKHKSKDVQLAKYAKELKEAREQSSNLTEEVAAVRDEICRNGKVVEEKEQMVKEDVESRVKETIRLEVREEITKEVEERTARKVRAAVRLEKDKEINALREQFKKVFKEHDTLKRQVDENADAAVQLRRVEDRDIPAFKAEIERLLTVIDETKTTHDNAISDLESFYQNKIKGLKEEGSREKWEHAAEIRKQMSKDREREVNDFTQRIEALSKQTDRLLQRAEREKEEYADQVRKRISQEKEREIQSLTNKLDSLKKESEELLQEATSDKQAFADQLRQQMAEERRREVNKLLYRIEVLSTERETLLKRVSAFEEELSWTWKEQERNIDKMKTSHSVLQSSEDDIFQLKRNNQGLATMVEQYRSRYEEANEELQALKSSLSGHAAQSENTSFTVWERCQQLETELEDAKKEYADAVTELEEVKSTLFESMTAYEERIAELMQERHQGTTSSTQGLLSSIENENHHLKQHVQELEQRFQSYGEGSGALMSTASPSFLIDPTAKHSAQELYVEISQLNEKIQEQSEILNQYKFNVDDVGSHNQQLKKQLQLSSATLEERESEIEGLRDAVKDAKAQKIQMTSEISVLRLALQSSQNDFVKVSQELEATGAASKSIQETNIENSLMVFQETNKISNGIQRLEEVIDDERRNHALPTSETNSSTSMEPAVENSLQSAMRSDTTISTTEFQQLTVKVDELTKLLLQTTEDRDEAREELRLCHDDNSILLKKVQDLASSLGVKRKELSQAFKELEHAKEKAAADEASAKQLRERIDRLTLILETTDRNRSKDSFVLEDTKKRLEGRIEEIDNLRDALDQAKEDLRLSKDGFEKELKDAEAASSSILVENEELRSKITTFEQERDKMKEELMHSKRLFHEALKKSEMTIYKLNSQIEGISEQGNDSQNEVESVARQLKASNNELKKALQDVEKRYQEGIKELERQLENVNDEKEKLATDIQHLENEYVLLTREFEDEKAKGESEHRKLKDELFACNRENLEVAKELQHSRQLFKEAMTAWRSETRDLNQQLNMWRDPDHVGRISGGRDSFSVQSLSQTDYDQSTHDGSTYNEASQDRLSDRGVLIRNGSSNVKKPIPVSPRGFFSSLMSVDTSTDDDTLSSPPLSFTPTQRKTSDSQYSSTATAKKVTWKSNALWDDGSETNGSRSDRATSTGFRATTSIDEPFDEPSELIIDSSAQKITGSAKSLSSLFSSSNASAGRGCLIESRHTAVKAMGDHQDMGMLPSQKPKSYPDDAIAKDRQSEESRDDIQSKDGSLFTYSSASNDSQLSHLASGSYIQGPSFRKSLTDQKDDEVSNSVVSSSSLIPKMQQGVSGYDNPDEPSTPKSWSIQAKSVFTFSGVAAVDQRNQQLQQEASSTSYLATSHQMEPLSSQGGQEWQQKQQQHRGKDEEEPFDEASTNGWIREHRHTHPEHFVSPSYSAEHNLESFRE